MCQCFLNRSPDVSWFCLGARAAGKRKGVRNQHVAGSCRRPWLQQLMPLLLISLMCSFKNARGPSCSLWGMRAARTVFLLHLDLGCLWQQRYRSSSGRERKEQRGTGKERERKGRREEERKRVCNYAKVSVAARARRRPLRNVFSIYIYRYLIHTP